MRLNPERVGDFIRHEGQEERYVCNTCGSQSLLLNEMKRLWFCFSCGEGGGMEEGVKVGDVPTMKRDRFTSLAYESLNSSHPTKTLSMLGIGVPAGNCVLSRHNDRSQYVDDPQGRIRLYATTVGWFSKLCYHIRPRFTLSRLTEMVYPGYAAFDLTVMPDDEPGILVYRPDTSIKYHTYGTRGLLVFGNPGASLLILVEGLFDALAMCAATWDMPGVAVVACLGKNVSPHQVEILLDRFSFATKLRTVWPAVLIAFDEGTEKESVDLMLQLQPYTQCRLLFPPVLDAFTVPELPEKGDVKDWDDLYRKVKGGPSWIRNAVTSAWKRQVES